MADFQAPACTVCNSHAGLLQCSLLSILSKDDSDYRVTPIGPISQSSFQTGSVQLLAEVDTVALEPMEFFTLTITLLGNQIPANAFASRSAFLHFMIDVWIVDASGKYLT